MEETLLKAYDRLVERLNTDRELEEAGNERIFSDYLRNQLILNVQAFEARYPEMINSNSPSQEDAMESFILREGKQPMAKRMLRADACFDARGLQVFLNVTDELMYAVQPAYYGKRLELVYTQGTLFRAMMYDTQVTGYDCYDSAAQVKGIPTKIPVTADLSVFHGVVVISKENHKAYNSKIPPHAAVDKILHSGEGMEYLEFILEEVLDSGCRLFDTDDSHYARLRRAHYMRIGVLAPDEPVSYENVAARIEELADREDECKYYCSDVLVKVNDILARDLIGGNSWALYWVTEKGEVSSVVTDVVFLTGLGGLVYPLIKVEPVMMHGVKVTGVGSSMVELNSLGIWIGDTIEMSQPGNRTFTRSVVLEKRPEDATPPVLPEHCRCGTALTVTGPRRNVLRCSNYHGCDQQIVARIKHYLGLDGVNVPLNELIIRKLVDRKKLRAIPDLYTLTVDDLVESCVPPTLARRTVQALSWAKEQVIQSRHLAAMMIPGIHPFSAPDLCNHAYIDSIPILALQPAYSDFLNDIVGKAPAVALKKFCEDERGAALLTKMGHLLRDVALEGDNGRDD